MRARDNPFRVERLHALRFRFPPGDDLDALRGRLDARRRRGAIVGPHGTGKTTLLAELADLLRRDGLRVRALRIGAGRHALSAGERDELLGDLAPDDAVLLDGAGHLLPWEWTRVRVVARRARYLVVTSHRRGRLPTLVRTSSSPELLAALARELGVEITPDAARRLLDAARGNVRDALRALYDARA